MNLICALLALYYWFGPSQHDTPRQTVPVQLDQTLYVDDMTEDQFAGVTHCLQQGRCTTITAGNVLLFMNLETRKIVAWMPAQDPAITGDKGPHF